MFYYLSFLKMLNLDKLADSGKRLFGLNWSSVDDNQQRYRKSEANVVLHVVLHDVLHTTCTYKHGKYKTYEKNISTGLPIA